MSGSKGYNTRAYVSSAPGAFAFIPTESFGAPAPAAPAVAYNAGAGSLAMGNAFVQVSWITANGESLPSAEGTVAVAAGTGAVTVTRPALPLNPGAPIIGWRVYSAGVTATEELNTVALSTTQAQVSFVTGQGTLKGFAVATTAVQVLIYGTGATVPVSDASGVQAALPSVGANTTVDYELFVPNTGSQWKVQKNVEYMRSDAVADPTGIVLSKIDCTQPVYPGVNTAVANGTVIVLNGYAFKAVQSGTQNTAATFIGFSNFKTTFGALTTDGSVTWQSFGKAAWLRFRFGNTSGSAAVPAAQAYELFQS